LIIRGRDRDLRGRSPDDPVKKHAVERPGEAMPVPSSIADHGV
jgi:hypothetical protein